MLRIGDTSVSTHRDPYPLAMYVQVIRLAQLFLAALAATTALFASAADFGTGMMAYQTGDFATARTQFETLANHGDKDAQFILGDMYAKGQGVPRDKVEAWKWYQLAAAGGAPDAAQAAAALGRQMTQPQLTRARERVLNWRPAGAVGTAPASTTPAPVESPNQVAAPAPPPANNDSGFFSNLARGATGLFGARDSARQPRSGATATIGIRGLTASDLRTAAPNRAALRTMQSFASSPSAAADFAHQAGLQTESVPYLVPATAQVAPSHKVSPLQH